MRNQNHETHLSAQQTSQKERARVYEKNEHTPRQKDLESSPQSGQIPAHTRLKFSKKSRLLTAKEFTLFSHKKSHAGAYLLITFSSHTSSTGPKLGIAVSKKFGKAHERNRFKRLVREAFRLNSATLPPLHFLIKPLKGAKEATCALIEQDLLSLLARKKENL